MKPNIVFIVLDAVRAQNLPFYGYGRETTPFLLSMERDLTIYENAVSSAYWTMPSVASLFTGTYKSRHGLTADGDRLDSSLVTLADVLRRDGYATAGFVRNVYVSSFSGLDRGFDLFHNTFWLDRLKKTASRLSRRGLSRLQPPGITRSGDAEIGMEGGSVITYFSQLAARVSDLALDSGSGTFVNRFSDWLGGVQDRPFFAFFQFLETHSPYRTPGRFAFSFLSPRDNFRRLSVNHDHLKFLRGECPMGEEDFRILTGAYDNSIRYADHLIRGIVDQLKRRGVYDRTMLVVLADHGDNIGDHGLMFHYFCLYDTLIRIPLLIKYPREAGLSGRVGRVVQNVDLYPTVLSLAGIRDRKAWEQTEGNDLLGIEPPRREEDLAVSELVKVFGPDKKHLRRVLSRYDRRLLSVRTRDRKFIYSSRGDHECYDLRRDPEERNNLYPAAMGFADLEEKARRAYGRMDRFYRENREKIDGEAGEQGIDESVAEHLKALGYL